MGLCFVCRKEEHSGNTPSYPTHSLGGLRHIARVSKVGSKPKPKPGTIYTFSYLLRSLGGLRHIARVSKVGSKPKPKPGTIHFHISSIAWEDCVISPESQRWAANPNPAPYIFISPP